ncbi:MAG: hypothetical protein HS127_20535 [Planctomycetia bacterium]|nr:hypothetical protein [Planctomycetia bacterium]
MKFLEMLDQKIYWIDDVPFSAYRPFFYWSLPRFANYQIRDYKIFYRLLLTKALGVIFPIGDGNKLINFFVSQPQYDIKTLHSKKRNQTRRGLERCVIQLVDWEQMRLEGLDINRESLERQQRRSGRLDNAHWWDRQCRVSAQFPDVKAWGAFVEGNLTAYVHVIIHDNVTMNGKQERVANIAHFMSDSRYLKHYPNEALIYTVTKELRDIHNCAFVMLGNTSDDPKLTLWKRHMGYQEEPVSFRVLANPVLHVAKYFVPKLKNYLNK